LETAGDGAGESVGVGVGAVVRAAIVRSATFGTGGSLAGLAVGAAATGTSDGAEADPVHAASTKGTMSAALANRRVSITGIS